MMRDPGIEPGRTFEGQGGIVPLLPGQVPECGLIHAMASAMGLSPFHMAGSTIRRAA
jgi:hypothetical protein